MRSLAFIALLLWMALGIPASVFAQQSVKKSPPIQTIHDPPTIKALQKSHRQLLDIDKSCAQQSQGKKKMNTQKKVRECLCDHAEDIVKANQIRIDALAALLEKNPDLKNQKIRVPGAFGSFSLNPQFLKKNDAESVRKQYDCH